MGSSVAIACGEVWAVGDVDGGRMLGGRVVGRWAAWKVGGWVVGWWWVNGSAVWVQAVGEGGGV